MAKAIKSFNVEKATYDELVKIFKKHGATTSLSFFVEQCLVKLLENLSQIEDVLEKTEYYPEIMKFVIERFCNELIVTTPGLRPVPWGTNHLDLTTEPESSMLHGMYTESEDETISEQDENDFPEGERPDDLEGLYWIEEYEAFRQNIPRVFARLLKTGKFELSRNRKLLIEKATGKRFVNIGGTHVVEVLANAKVIGPGAKK